MLAWAIYLSFAGALAEALLPKGRAALARWLALAMTVAGLVDCRERALPRQRGREE